MGQEEVHGSMESGVQVDKPHDGPIPQQGEGIEQGKESKEELLQPWVGWKSQENELCDQGHVVSHIPVTEKPELRIGSRVDFTLEQLCTSFIYTLCRLAK